MATQNDMWTRIGDILREQGYHLVRIDGEEDAVAEPQTKRSFAPMVSRRDYSKDESSKSVAAKVTRVAMRGRPSGATTLTPEQVREIRECYKPRTERVTASSLAQKYGVSIPTVRLIISGRDAAKHKLTPEDLSQIREAYKPAKSNSAVELATRFGVTPTTIISGAQGKTHKDVQPIEAD